MTSPTAGGVGTGQARTQGSRRASRSEEIPGPREATPEKRYGRLRALEKTGAADREGPQPLPAATLSIGVL